MLRDPSNTELVRLLLPVLRLAKAPAIESVPFDPRAAYELDECGCWRGRRGGIR